MSKFKILKQNLSFGAAIESLKKGNCVSREGWNGKKMHIYFENMYHEIIQAGIYKGTERRYDPVICMFTAQKTHQPGWLASQADILANDWCIIDPG